VRLSLSESFVHRNFCKATTKLFPCQEKFFRQFKKLSVYAGFKSKFFFFEVSKKYDASHSDQPRDPRDAGVMRATRGLCGRSAGYAGAMRVHARARAGAMRGIRGLCPHCGRDAGAMGSSPTEKRQKSSGARALCTPPHARTGHFPAPTRARRSCYSPHTTDI